MPRPINLFRLRRTERPVWRHRDWRYDPWSVFIWVWLRDCPGGYDRHKWWRWA
jgi:hypothetical protein